MRNDGGRQSRKPLYNPSAGRSFPSAGLRQRWGKGTLPQEMLAAPARRWNVANQQYPVTSAMRFPQCEAS